MNQQNKFVIYTTGISSWGSHDIIDNWIEIRRDNILKCIDDRFSDIYIYHYDPLLEIGGMDLPDTKYNIEKYINYKLNFPKNSKIKKELFIIEPFNYLMEFEYPYIIIDSAHLFSYKYNNIDGHYLIYNNYYNENKLNIEKIKNIKSIYISYPSKNDNLCEHIIYFKIDDNYNIITFSEKLLELGYTYQYTPCDIINKIFNNIKNNIYILWRIKYIRVGCNFDIWFNKIKPLILNQLCINIFDNSINKEKIENYENYNIIIPNLDILEDYI